MSCDERFEKLLDLANGELSWLEQAELEAHIDSCSACRQRAESLRAMETRITRVLRRPMPSSDPTADIMAQVAEQTRPSKARWARVWAVGLAMGLCIGLGVRLRISAPPVPSSERKHALAKTMAAGHVLVKPRLEASAIDTSAIGPVRAERSRERNAAGKSAVRASGLRRVAKAQKEPDLAPGAYWVIRSGDTSDRHVDAMGSAVWEIRSADGSEKQEDVITVVDAGGNTLGPARSGSPVPVPEHQAKFDTRCEPGEFLTAEDSHHLEHDRSDEPAPNVRG